MTDPAQIARGLSKAQRAEVISLSSEWTQRRWGQEAPWIVWLPPSLLEQATPTRINFQRLRLTPLGLAVRAELDKNSA